MSQVAQKHVERLELLKEKVKTWKDYFGKNEQRFNDFRRFIFDTMINEKDRQTLAELRKPVIEFNILEAYISRLRGEFSKQEPSIKVSVIDGEQVDPKLPKVIESYFRAILAHANLTTQMEYDIYTDLLSGGYSVGKVYTEYEHDRSFDQVIRIMRVFDPTLCGFDPMAREPHKGDGEYCFEIYPVTKDRAKEEFGIDTDKIRFSRDIEGFNWSYSSEKGEDVLLLCDFYEKKRKRTTILKVSDGQSLTTDEYEKFLEEWISSGNIEQPPTVISKRTTHFTKIMRYRFCETEMIEATETQYDYLPLIFADGNSIQLRENSGGVSEQHTKPYVYHTLGAQRLKNFAGQSLANELENSVQHKFIAAKEGIPAEYAEAYQDVQIPSTVIYNAYKDDDPNVPLPPPRLVERPPIPQEFTQTFAMTDSVIQNILGSYDAALGINNNQLSGKAMLQGALQSNAASQPYIVGILQFYNRVAQVVINLLPKYAVTPSTIPMKLPDGTAAYQKINQPNDPESLSMGYSSNALHISVSAGANFSAQRSQALQQLEGIARMSEQAQSFINAKGLPFILDNLEMRGIEELKEAAKEWSAQQEQQQAQQQQQPEIDPMVLRSQENQQKAMYNHQKLSMEAQQNAVENQIKAQRLQLEKEALHNEKVKTLLAAEASQQDNDVALTRSQTERFAKMAEMDLKSRGQSHDHTVDIAKILKDDLK